MAPEGREPAGSEVDLCGARESFRQPAGVDLAAREVGRRSSSPLLPPVRKAAQQLESEGVDLAALGDHPARLLVRQVLSEPAHGTDADIEPQALSRREALGHGLRPEAGNVEDIEAVGRSGGLGHVPQGRLLAVRVRIEGGFFGS